VDKQYFVFVVVELFFFVVVELFFFVVVVLHFSYYSELVEQALLFVGYNILE
jgi:hypothetical protein